MKSRRLYDIVGILLSAAIIVAAILLWQEYEASSLELNEIGDFLAGIISALALVWLVLGYRLQRRELSLQLQELHESTQTQKEQNEALLEQARLLSITSNALLEHTRPYITASLQWDGHQLILRIRNDGTRPAENVRLIFEPALHEIADERIDPSTIFMHGTIPPKTEFSESIVHGFTLYHKNERVDFETKVSISYSDEEGKQFSHSYPITLRGYARNIAQRRTKRSSLHHITETLGDPRVGNYDTIRKSLHKISDTLEQIKDGLDDSKQ